MSLKKFSLLCLITFVITSCKNESNTTVVNTTTKLDTTKVSNLSNSQKIIAKTIAAHGGKLYNTAHYSFNFRGDTYIFKNEGNEYEYKKIYDKAEFTITDALKNGTFSRTINNNAINLTDEQAAKEINNLNSVIYFATLPHKLSDKAVNSKYIESTTIKNKPYHVIEVTFNKNGGGEDYEDIFYYWINTSTNKIDYLAYSYKVNKGGIRFRSAYNSRVIDGITFQDYINYKAEVGTHLKDLPKLYEANKLEEVSRIQTENIFNLNNQ